MEPTSNPRPVLGFLRVIRTVASGMFGLRGRESHEKDAPSLSPVHIIVTALVFMLIFVATMVSIATWVVGK